MNLKGITSKLQIYNPTLEEAIKKEREACAKLVEDLWVDWNPKIDRSGNSWIRFMAFYAASIIRERK